MPRIRGPPLLLLVLCLVPFIGLCDAARIPRQATEEEVNCGYQSCHAVDPNKLNIHLVPHTHDDVGWLKTVDQYYFGSRSRIQKAGVQYIIDSVIQALLVDPNRRFIYVETAFLWKWWLRQSDKVKSDVISLINQGRLEIIGGAWSMNDEAVTHYHSIVDQFTWGFRRLNDTFGSCARPRIGWQIDPFGHAREQASLFAQMGFDGMLFGRIDYQDKAKRLREKTMEFVWKGSPSLGKRADLFTTAMFNTYSPPPGFCFDILCADEPVVDDPDSPDYNVGERIELFLAYAEVQARSYQTNNIILTMGDDFNYQHAEMWFTNLDKLIRYTNERNGSTVNLIYSTPSCYLKALHDLNRSWPTKTDDFFPYASDPHAYWTGYFSSRPTVKFMERMGNNLLQVSKQLSVLTDLKNHNEHLENFREVMGVMQHHDAVTGTEKQLVSNDYVKMLYQSMYNGGNIAGEAVSKWMNGGGSSGCTFRSCYQLNISSCGITEDNKHFLVTVYNPQSRVVSNYVRLPVQGNSYVVQDYKGREIVSQLVPIADTIDRVPGRHSKATNEIVFLAEDVPALGYSVYNLQEKTGGLEIVPDTATSIGGDTFDISVNNEGSVVVEYKKQKDINFIQSFHYYEGAEGNNAVFANRSSGAYIFRPIQTAAKSFLYRGTYKIFKGPLVEEIHQNINEWISQVVRVYKGNEHIEFDWLVGPIPVQDKIGKEIVTRYSSNLKSNEVFYTDSNGREMLQRVRNRRPTWDLDLHEPVSGNYYPVTSKISLDDKARSLKLNVLTDRSQGGTSMQDGEIELMLHRRLLKDDAFGVGEALNESAYGEGLVVRGSHYVFGGSIKDSDAFVLKEKKLALDLALRPWYLIANAPCDGLREESLQSAGLNKPLPPNVHILTLEPWKDDTVLLRLEHLFEVGEATGYSQPVEINLKGLFSTFDVVSIEETTLGGNQWLKDSNPLKWEIESNEIQEEYDEGLQPINVEDNAINVLIKPMEIRTFILKVSPRQL